MPETTLPFGSEFSPSQIHLPELLSLCEQFSGNKEELESAILSRYFSAHGRGSEDNQRKLAMNCRLGLKAYGIIDGNCVITTLGKKLCDLKDNENALYVAFAKHILLNLNGMGFIQCIRDMTVALETINLTTLRQSLAERGIHYPSGGKHPSMMRLWLDKAGIFVGSRWQLNNDKINEILGIDDSMEALRRLTPLQRAFLLALANSGISDPQPANQIVKLAETTYGVKFPEKSLPKEVLNGLSDAGFITANKTTSGRGAKPFLVAPTEKVEIEIVSPLIKQLAEQTDPKLTALLVKSIPEILQEMKSLDTYISGLALEALAFKLLRILGMDYLATRLRAESTGGSEVDLLFHTARLVYSRWQVQCKNTAHVSLDQVAKEIGLVQVTYANVIVVIGTGKISDSARTLANRTMKQTNICIVFVDGKDIERISTDPSAIVDVFDREARATMQLKKLDLW
jgi:site-specific DNA-methyltransferase (cytosine-N4-specific)